MKLLVVVQARTGSTRLPNKILLPLAGAPLLQRMVERVGAGLPGKLGTWEFELVVATTTEPSDNPVEQLCSDLGLTCYRGHPTDLLDRHYQAARRESADAIAKIPSDCPLIDPEVIARVVTFFIDHRNEYDFVSNLHPATYPDGNDVEVMPMSVLETAWREATKSYEREHTTPFIWEQPDRFHLANITWETGLDYSMSHRWTIDYPEDYEMIRRVYDELWSRARPVFGIQDILGLLERKPEIAEINARYAGVNWYRHHLHELKTIAPRQTKILTGT
jgi:spore coat polysaccharide biosynthesis protein SpsF